VKPYFEEDDVEEAEEKMTDDMKERETDEPPDTCEQLANALREKDAQAQKDRAEAFASLSREMLLAYVELFPNFTWLDPQQALQVFRRAVLSLRWQIKLMNKAIEIGAQDAVEEMFPMSPAKPSDSMTLIERDSVAEYRKRFLAEKAEIIARHFTPEPIVPVPIQPRRIEARTDIINLLAQYDAVIEGRESEGEYEPDADDAAIVDDIRQRWGMKGDPGDPPITADEKLDQCAPYVCDHDYCDLEECRCKCHQDTAVAAVRELAPFTDQPLSKIATIRRQHILICELRERVNEYLTTLRAVSVEGLGLTDPWAETATDEAPDEWTGLLSEKVAELRRERDEARTDAAARLKQMLNQSDLDKRAIKEWEQALTKATDLLRPFVRMEFNSMSGEDTIINGAKQSDFDAAKVFLDGFDSRRKAKKGRV
jgi:hypothetical protein